MNYRARQGPTDSVYQPCALHPAGGHIYLPAPAGLEAPEGSEATGTLNPSPKVAASLLLALPHSFSSGLDEQDG